MSNEEEEVIIPEDKNEEVDAPEDKNEDLDTTKKDEKPIETDEARYARLKRQTAQMEKKLGIKSEEEPKKKTSKKSDDLGYGEKAFLVAHGVKEADEINLAKDYMANTGKSLDDVIGSKFFQSELKELRETKATSAATPPGSKRTGQSAQTTVEYWLAKGELPPMSERELRQKVVNARLKAETSSDIFTKNPVVK